MKKNIFRLVSIITSLLSIEIICATVLYLVYGYYPYKYNAAIKDIQGRINDVTYANPWKEYPYLGYKNPHSMEELSSMINGTKPSSEYWVGIFGGSVAEIFAKNQQAVEDLEKSLSTLSQTKGRKVRVINLAMGGFKQPQQMIGFALFGEPLDLAINIEGSNEVSDFLFADHIPRDFPVTSLRYHYNGPGRGYLQISRLVAELLDKLYFHQPFQPFRYSSATMTLMARTLSLSLAHLSNYLFNEFQEKYCREIHCYPQREHENERLIQQWEKDVKDQFLLSRLSKVPLFIFIQPSQYVEGSKKFSDWELKNAIDSSRSQHLTPRYQMLLAKSHQLREKGLQIHDLVNIFEHRTDTIYTDSCCHFNDIGNQLMSKRIFQVISSHFPQNKEI